LGRIVADLLPNAIEQFDGFGASGKHRERSRQRFSPGGMRNTRCSRPSSAITCAC